MAGGCGLGLAAVVLAALLAGSAGAAAAGVAAIVQVDKNTRLDDHHHAIPVELALFGDLLFVWIILGLGLLVIPALMLLLGVVAGVVGAGTAIFAPGIVE